MKKFNPEMKVVRFGNEDVIVTSGLVHGSTMTFQNFANGNITDNVIDFDYRTSFSFGVNTKTDDVISAIGADGGTQIYSQESGNYDSLTNVIGTLIDNNDQISGTWNYTFTYDSSTNKFSKQ